MTLLCSILKDWENQNRNRADRIKVETTAKNILCVCTVLKCVSMYVCVFVYVDFLEVVWIDQWKVDKSIPTELNRRYLSDGTKQHLLTTTTTTEDILVMLALGLLDQ